MVSFFRELFEYSYHFNGQLIQIMLETGFNESPKSISLLHHTLSAHQIWNNRIAPEEPLFKVWQSHELKDLEFINKKNYEKTLKILDSFDLNAEITYKTSMGDPFLNTIRDILFHVVNHSTYHRGQIASDLKINNITPIVSDYIFYKR